VSKVLKNRALVLFRFRISPAQKEGMGTSESKVHSFIVKLWHEDDATSGSKWHGYITHVPDAERRYFQDLNDIVSFIKPYLANEGDVVAAPKKPRWLRWVRRR
jgi:hypothetical protein